MIDVLAEAFRGPLRRQLVESSHLNGLDYVELDENRPATLLLYFLKAVPEHAYGLRRHPHRITVSGGTRVIGIRVVRVEHLPAGPGQPEEAHLRVTLDRPGDRSLYTVHVDASELDPCFRTADFSFATDAPVEADCEAPPRPAEPLPPEPILDYLAKDYASFRQALLDLLAQIKPGWIEQSPADLGIALLELLAYVGDQLSYLQDAVANEAYFGRARLRVSARRHARLLDYRMHDGRNAWTWVRFGVTVPGAVPRGTRLVTQIQAPLGHGPEPPDTVIQDLDESRISAASLETDPALAAVAVFETAHEQTVDPLNNEIWIHGWGATGGWLPAGATSAFLYALDPRGIAVRPPLHAGDWLLFEDAKDASHRQVVLLESEPAPVEDAVFSAATVNRNLQLASCSGASRAGPLPLLLVNWRASDAIATRFPLSAPGDAVIGCPPAGSPLPVPLTIVRGNLAMADHGLTTRERLGVDPRALGHRPLTMCCPPGHPDLSCDVHDAVPAITLQAPDGRWKPARDLLESGPFDQNFVVEVDDEGVPHVRFGDGVHGADPSAEEIWATYRVGNGSGGNVGAGSLAHLLVTTSLAAPWLANVSVSNPLPARGGVEPETVGEVQARAPQAAQVQERAVTESDYRSAVLSVAGAADAAASLRWTGSWRTAFVGVQPRDPAGLVAAPGGGLRLAPPLAAAVTEQLERYRLAGTDLEVRAPRYIGLDIALRVRISAGHFRGEVLQAVAAVLGSRRLPDGTSGLFAQPGQFSFGTPVFLSQVYAAAQGLDGVDSISATRFRPFGQPDGGELAEGVIRMGVFEIARLDNDPHHPELGALHLTAIGGKG